MRETPATTTSLTPVNNSTYARLTACSFVNQEYAAYLELEQKDTFKMTSVSSTGEIWTTC